MQELLEVGPEGKLAWGIIYGLAVGLGMYWVGLGLTLWRLRWRESPCPSYPPVSVLVATHRPGEARRLLEQLNLLQYEASWEVVLVLDRLPEESRVELHETIAQVYIPVRMVEITETAVGWSPKKYALMRGLEIVKYEWIAILDADVEVKTDYLMRLMGGTGEGVEAVVGPGWLMGNGVGGLSAWEAALIQVESVGRAAWGWAYMATGRGWALRKNWLKQGLYLWREVISGDDDLTLQLIPRHGIRASGAMTISKAPQSWSAHIRRKRRHLQTGWYYGVGLLFSLGVGMVAYGSLWGFVLLTGDFWGAPLLVWAARVMAVYLSGAPLRWWQPLWDFPLLVLQIIYPLLGLMRIKQW